MFFCGIEKRKNERRETTDHKILDYDVETYAYSVVYSDLK